MSTVGKAVKNDKNIMEIAITSALTAYTKSLGGYLLIEQHKALGIGLTDSGNTLSMTHSTRESLLQQTNVTKLETLKVKLIGKTRREAQVCLKVK